MESDRFIVDSSILVSFYHQEDVNHPEALRIMSGLEQKFLVIHPYVIQEVITVLTYKAGNKIAAEFISDIFENAPDILIPALNVQNDAEFFKILNKKISLTDATLVNLSKTLHLPVVTFDKQIISLIKN
ncbi:MAG: PIN domain-containing protein [Patescibacteria group bacterium]